jgi:GTPase-activating protein SAC7
MRQKRSQSMVISTPLAVSPSVKRDKFRGRRCSSLYIVERGNDSSEALAAGIVPDQKRNFVLRLFDRFVRENKSDIEPEAEPQEPEPDPAPGIFGVPLRQSITYANVAISLVDEKGESYIYGYVPIVVAKCGVYLKEKGVFRVRHVRARKLTTRSSY